MHKTNDRVELSESGQVTIPFLLSAIELIMPLVFAFQKIKAAGGGVLQYVAAVVLSLLLGGAIVVLEWRSNRLLWQRAQTLCDRAQTTLAVGLVALHRVDHIRSHRRLATGEFGFQVRGVVRTTTAR